MEIEEFNRYANILGKKYVPMILEEISKSGWVKASELSSYLHFSTATAMNYLRDLESIGILEKRRGKGETGEVWEYNLKSNHISLETTIE